MAEFGRSYRDGQRREVQESRGVRRTTWREMGVGRLASPPRDRIEPQTQEFRAPDTDTEGLSQVNPEEIGAVAMPEAAEVEFDTADGTDGGYRDAYIRHDDTDDEGYRDAVLRHDEDESPYRDASF